MPVLQAQGPGNQQRHRAAGMVQVPWQQHERRPVPARLPPCRDQVGRGAAQWSGCPCVGAELGQGGDIQPITVRCVRSAQIRRHIIALQQRDRKGSRADGARGGVARIKRKDPAKAGGHGEPAGEGVAAGGNRGDAMVFRQHQPVARILQHACGAGATEAQMHQARCGTAQCHAAGGGERGHAGGAGEHFRQGDEEQAPGQIGLGGGEGEQLRLATQQALRQGQLSDRLHGSMVAPQRPRTAEQNGRRVVPGAEKGLGQAGHDRKYPKNERLSTRSSASSSDWGSGGGGTSPQPFSA